MSDPVPTQTTVRIPLWADEATYIRRRLEAQALMERFIGRTSTPELQAEINALVAPILRSWEMEDAGHVVVN